MSDPHPRSGLFPQTRWTLVLAARERPELRRQALDELLRTRWKALFILARGRGLPREQAEDAVQSFVERLIEGDLLVRLDPGRGRLRGYLRTALQNHITNLATQDDAAKRGGGQRALSMDDAEELMADPASDPEALFDRAWALTLFADALGDLEREFSEGRRHGPFDVLRELFRFGETEPYEAIAARHAMTVPQLKSFVHRSKQRFRQILAARVADTVADPNEAAAELDGLIQALSS